MWSETEMQTEAADADRALHAFVVTRHNQGIPAGPDEQETFHSTKEALGAMYHYAGLVFADQPAVTNGIARYSSFDEAFDAFKAGYAGLVPYATE